MNVKIKANGVACLLGGDYDRIYASLKKSITDSSLQLFAERKPGHDYLQWELPGDGWTELQQADATTKQLVKNELQRRRIEVERMFGNNQSLAQKIMTVPDESYIFFKQELSGEMAIRLTAWGYRYPEKVGGNQSTGHTNLPKTTHPLTVKVVCDGEGVPRLDIKVNGFNRLTDEQGKCELGELPVGFEFDVEVEEQVRHIIVNETESIVVFDVTKQKEVIPEDSITEATQDADDLTSPLQPDPDDFQEDHGQQVGSEVGLNSLDDEEEEPEQEEQEEEQKEEKEENKEEEQEKPHKHISWLWLLIPVILTILTYILCLKILA